MTQRASLALFCAGALACLSVGPAAAQMEVQPSLRPVDPNATPDSPLNPRKSLLHPQPVRPDPVRPTIQSPPTPYPEALRPGRAPPPPPGYVVIPEKPGGRPGRAAAPAGALDRPGRIPDALLACWRPPALPVRQEATVRIAFNRQGGAIGEPRIAYIGGAVGPAHRESLRKSVLAAVSRCLPLRFTPALASAIAGRPFAIRFIAPARKPAGPST